MEEEKSVEAKTQSKKSKALKTVRNVAISIVVLALLVVGAGAAYVWYMGDSEGDDQEVASATSTDITPNVKTHVPDANAKPSATIQMLSTPIAPGDDASLTVRSLPTAKCKLKVEYNKVAARDPGLKDQIADDFGMATWNWTIPSTAPVGKWPIKATCLYNKKSAMVQGTLEIKNGAP